MKCSRFAIVLVLFAVTTSCGPALEDAPRASNVEARASSTEAADGEPFLVVKELPEASWAARQWDQREGKRDAEQIVCAWAVVSHRMGQGPSGRIDLRFLHSEPPFADAAFPEGLDFGEGPVVRTTYVSKWSDIWLSERAVREIVEGLDGLTSLGADTDGLVVLDLAGFHVGSTDRSVRLTVENGYYRVERDDFRELMVRALEDLDELAGRPRVITR